MKWKAKLAEVGLMEDKLSIGLRKKIKEYQTLAEGLEEARQALDDADAKDAEAIEADIEEIEEALLAADEKLTRAIEVYDKNKERYAELGKNLVPKGKKKTTAEPTPTPTPTPNPTPTPAPTPSPKSKEKGGEVSDEKKKSGAGWLVFALFAGVVTLGAVNLFKRD